MLIFLYFYFQSDARYHGKIVKQDHQIFQILSKDERYLFGETCLPLRFLKQTQVLKLSKLLRGDKTLQQHLLGFDTNLE